jgi:opacity protein-like surface antigen
MTTFFSRIAIAIALFGLATPALAQQTQRPRPERPYTGLFGGGVGETEQILTASGSLGGGYDTNIAALTAESTGLNVPVSAGQNAAAYGQLGAGLSYELSKKRAGLSASLSTSGRYLPTASTPYIAGHGGGVGASIQLSRSARLTASHMAVYHPYKTLLLGPVIIDAEFGPVVVGDQSLGVQRHTFLSQASAIGFNRTLGRRSSLDFSYGQTRSDIGSPDGAMKIRTFGGRFSTGLTKSLGIHLGYGRSEGRFFAGNADTVRQDNIDVGMDFRRALSLTRRTSLSFSTGTSAINDSVHTFYSATGEAELNREIGRSWLAAATYKRGVSFVEQFPVPFFSDSVTLSLGGLINRRVQFHSGASAVKGQAGLSVRTNPYRSYQGSVGFNTALTTHLAVGVDYFYYQYGFESFELLPDQLPRTLGRHGVRISLNAWAPLFHRSRRPDATR